jgi:hypothetical protein
MGLARRLTLTLFACVAFSLPVDSRAAQPEIAIEGRTEAVAGQLVTLRALTDSPKIAWVWDRSQIPDVIRCGDQFGFAAPVGTYKIWLVADVGEELQTAVHVVRIEPADPQPSQPPPESPPAGSDALEQAAAEIARLAVSLNEPQTLALLVAEWRSAAAAIRAGPTLEDAGKAVKRANETAFGKRDRQTARYGQDWLEGFRQPVEQLTQRLVDAGAIRTPANLAALYESVLRSLDKQR